MELTELSSNWKKLQKQLEREKAAAAPAKKRKFSDSFTISHSRPTTDGRAAKRFKKAPKSSSHIIRKSDIQTAKSEKDSPAPTAPPDNQRTIDAASASTAFTTPKVSNKKTPGVGLVKSVRTTKYVAMDCEMVGVGSNPNKESALARVSLVNYHGELVYDVFVQPQEAITDYRTHVSGITPELVARGGGARKLKDVQKEVAGVLDGKILVGHAVQNDLRALFLKHSRRDIRDTSAYRPYRQMVGGRSPGLRRLAKELLGIEIQARAHSSVEDARATMELFKREKVGFEREARRFQDHRRGQATLDDASGHEPDLFDAPRRTGRRK